jgi:hypothetical protein
MGKGTLSSSIIEKEEEELEGGVNVSVSCEQYMQRT